jgi:hypothetical protein
MTDRFGNPKKWGRLYMPRGSRDKGYNTTIQGLAQGIVEIKGDKYRIKVSGTRNPKNEDHCGGFEIVLLPKRTSRGSF